jgi:hypothetical protein
MELDGGRTGSGHSYYGSVGCTDLQVRLVRDSMTRMLPRAALKVLDGYFCTAHERLKKLPNSAISQWPDKVRMVSRSLNFEAPNIDETVLDSLYEALQQEQCFELEYRVRSGKDKKYVVNPLGLVFVDNLIYLVATLNDYFDVKQLLAHRMKSIRLLPDRPATTPAGFTLQGYINCGEFGYPLGGMINLKALLDKDCSFRLQYHPGQCDIIVYIRSLPVANSIQCATEPCYSCNAIILP